MGGLPRSGSTLLTTILNQNPKIHASHHTELLTAMFEQVQRSNNYEPYRLGLHTENYFDLVRQMPEAFYSRRQEEIIIDNNRKWGAPFSLAIASYFTTQPKFLILIRPIIEVLASFVTLARKNPNNYIDRAMEAEDFLPRHYLPIDDARCEWLLRPNSQIDVSLLAISTLQQSQNKDQTHFIPYEQLVNDSQMCLQEIYAFLEMEPFDHQFANLDNYANPLDGQILGIQELHAVRPSISKLSNDPKKVLSKRILRKYEDIFSEIGK